MNEKKMRIYKETLVACIKVLQRPKNVTVSVVEDIRVLGRDSNRVPVNTKTGRCWDIGEVGWRKCREAGEPRLHAILSPLDHFHSTSSCLLPQLQCADPRDLLRLPEVTSLHPRGRSVAESFFTDFTAQRSSCFTAARGLVHVVVNI
jgi:hypothetical protein